MADLAKYAEAIWPALGVSCGARLRPYTLGHAHLLCCAGSPFLLGDRPAGLGDLLLASEICRRPWRKSARLAGGRLLPLLLRWNARRALRQPASWAEAQIGAMTVHLTPAMPQIWSKKNDARALGTSWLQQIRVTLLGRLGASYETVMDVPVAQAIWDCCAHWEMEGTIELGNSSDDALLAAAKRMMAAKATSPART